MDWRKDSYYYYYQISGALKASLTNNAGTANPDAHGALGARAGVTPGRKARSRVGKGDIAFLSDNNDIHCYVLLLL